MKNVKIVARILFVITRLLSILYFGMVIHSLVAFTTGWSLILQQNGNYFQICLPFTKTVYLAGDYTGSYIGFEFLSPLSLYGLFFLLVSNVFQVFYQPKLFTAHSIKHLKWFYLVNLILPGIVVIATSIFAETEDGVIVLVAIHFILGVFAYFLAAIFKQGLNLQNEQDLII